MATSFNSSPIWKGKSKKRGEILTGFAKVLFLSSAACLVMSASPPLTVVSAIIWGITLLLGGYFLGRTQLFLIFGLNLLLLFGVAGNSILFLLLIFGLPSFIMGLQLAAEKGYYELQVWGMLSAILLVSLYLGMAFYYSNPYQNIIPEQINSNVEESIEIIEDSGMLQLYQQQGFSPDELKTELTTIYNWAFRHLAAWYFIEAMLAVFVVLRLGAYVSRRKGLAILIYRSYAEEIMPWPMAWVVIAGLTLWLWGREQYTHWYYIGSNILIATLPVTLYYGMATITYLWHRVSVLARRLCLIFLGLTVLIFPLPAVIFIGLLGLFDSLLDYRGLEPKKEEWK